ncbi:MAG: GntR family transcriptional regulator, partial [Anaerolineales bacterium]
MLNNGPIPKHYQLSQLIRQQILEGTLAPGSKIPGENQLCQQYQLSRGTVRKAISTLVNEGLLRTEQGHGTYVVEQPWRSRYFLALNQFNEEMIRHQRQPKTILLERKLIAATKEISEHLQIPLKSAVIYIARLRLANETPILYEKR